MVAAGPVDPDLLRWAVLFPGIWDGPRRHEAGIRLNSGSSARRPDRAVLIPAGVSVPQPYRPA
ncbi:hypothetical protein [Saccharothrix sp. NRRL B-16348]|uniref:hypothetical protein n=1 Tax=Saccharothrix sp. NRRL B-16348 TaxID=1415542 RepID=UPI0012FB4252|nr:hypothetical protein [Saccharothrix sp. NRRL B-16348]